MVEQSGEPRGRVFVRDEVEDLRRWFAHRCGMESFVPTIPGPLGHRKALELDERARRYTESHGDREIEGFVAFIDLKGFSTAVEGRSSKEIHEFVAPFLQGVIDAAVRNYCFIDKTIGDEVMVVHPNMADVGSFKPWLMFASTLDQLAVLHRKLGPQYRFRVGLSYGALYLGQVGAGSFHEWTVFGEAVHLAKRLQTLDVLERAVTDRGIGIAFGMLEHETALPGFVRISRHPLDLMIAFLKGRFFEAITPSTLPQLKGVSPYQARYLIPNAEFDAYDPNAELVEK